MFLRPIDDPTQYSDYQPIHWQAPPWQRDGFEWVAGDPPDGAIPYIALGPMERISQAYQALSPDLQDKYENLLAVGALHFEHGNLKAVQRKLTQAQAIADAGNQAEVDFLQNISDLLDI